jgi:hypothetical protein
MSVSPFFVRAFLSGLAAPVSVFSAGRPYTAYLGNCSVAGTFASVGYSLTRAAAVGAPDARPEAAATDTADQSS